MDIKGILSEVAVTPAGQARALGVSDGHIADLTSARRELSVELALKLEALTKRKGLVDAVVARKAERRAAKQRDAAA